MSESACGDTLPGTPDHDVYPVRHRIEAAAIDTGALRITWDDSKTSLHHPLLLRENSADPETVHPLTREMLISPSDIPADIRPERVEVEPSGALRVTWSHGGHESRYHPGWLRAHAWLGEGDESEDADLPPPALWAAADLASPPTADGPSALKDDSVLLEFLETLHRLGIARLENLPHRDGLLEEVVTRIGPVRETNFGRTYELNIKPDPNSNAFTSSMLLQHMDLPTRENPPGLQFLHCLANTTTGGEGIYVDGFRIAEDLRRSDPGLFGTLTTVVWEFRNRDKGSDYRASGPFFRLGADGRIDEVRANSWLRAPLKAPVEVQEKAYRAVRLFVDLAQSERYQLVFTYRAGDLVAFDNRRLLHGRRAYDAGGGERHMEGAYADRDDLHSRIRTIRRKQRAAATG